MIVSVSRAVSHQTSGPCKSDFKSSRERAGAQRANKTWDSNPQYITYWLMLREMGQRVVKEQ
jgi:hypothetical protein